MANIHQFYTDSPLRNYNYFIELNENEVIAVDPLLTEQVLKWCDEEQKKLKTIIITHEHPDHINAKDELKTKTGAEIWAHESAKDIITNVDRYLTHKEEIEIHGGKIEILHTPGHTPTHICLLIKNTSEEHESLIAMDTVFNAGVGHCKLGGDPKVLYQTIKMIGEYVDDDAILYPGHDYIENNLKFTLDREVTNERARELLKLAEEIGGQSIETDLGMEKEINAFFRLDSKAIRKKLGKETGIKEFNDEEVFLNLRRLRDNW